MGGERFAILTVCTGNVNRSALAESLLRTWSGWYLAPELASRVTVSSAGTRAPHDARMRRRVQAIAASLGADGVEHRARQLEESDILGADLILTAPQHHRDAVLERVPSALRSTFTIREAGRIAARLGGYGPPGSVDDLVAIVSELGSRRSDVSASEDDSDDIVDPEGHDDATFRLMAAEEVPPLAHLGGLLFGMPRGDLVAYTAAPEERDLLRGVP